MSPISPIPQLRVERSENRGTLMPARRERHHRCRPTAEERLDAGRETAGSGSRLTTRKLRARSRRSIRDARRTPVSSRSSTMASSARWPAPAPRRTSRPRPAAPSRTDTWTRPRQARVVPAHAILNLRAHAAPALNSSAPQPVPASRPKDRRRRSSRAAPSRPRQAGRPADANPTELHLGKADRLREPAERERQRRPCRARCRARAAIG